jgi:hypothetical protein
MPFHQDFSSLYSVGELTTHPNGWIDDLIIEYGYGRISHQINFYWRVKGTNHTFRLPLNILNEHSKGNYDDHIKYVLENFRLEYLSWAAQGFPQDWMVEYHKEYRNFIQL